MGVELLSGLVGGYAQAQKEKNDRELKDLIVKKTKIDLELLGRKEQASAALAGQLYGNNPMMALGMYAGLNPKDILMLQAINGGMGGGAAPATSGQPDPAAETPGVTFPASLTGTPTAPGNQNFQFNPKTFLEKEMYGWSSNPNDVTGDVRYNDPSTGRNMVGMRTRAGQIINTLPDRMDVTWQERQNPLGPEYPPILQGVSKSGQDIPGLVQQKPNELVPIPTKDASGSERVTYMPKYKTPPSLNLSQTQPQQQPATGSIQLNLDPTTMTAKDVDVLADNLKKQIKTGGGTPTTGVQTSPGATELPIAESDLPLWVHPQTMISPPIGTSPKAAEAQGYKRLTVQARERVDSIKQVGNVLDNIEALATKAFGPKDWAAQQGWVGQRTVGAITRNLGALTQSNPDVAELKSRIEGTLAPLIRAMGEKGTLSDTDIKRANSLIVNLSDTPEVAWRKMTGLRDLFQSIQQNTIAGGGGTAKPKSTAATAPSQSDLEFTARKYGMTVDDVKKKLGMQ